MSDWQFLSEVTSDAVLILSSRTVRGSSAAPFFPNAEKDAKTNRQQLQAQQLPLPLRMAARKSAGRHRFGGAACVNFGNLMSQARPSAFSAQIPYQFTSTSYHAMP